jgi:periplasmic divalent cation tolerance protein
MADSTPEIRIALTTVGDADAARRLARALVEERLAACVNVVPGVESVYRWEGAVESAAEHLLVIKTTAAAWPRLLARLGTLHPYALPELVALAPGAVSAAYARWVGESVD